MSRGSGGTVPDYHARGAVGVGGDGIVECRRLPTAEVGETVTFEWFVYHTTQSNDASP